MSSKLEIINNGLKGAGLRPVTAANSADKWQILSSQYQNTVDAELESGNYQFTTYREALTGSVAGNFGYTTGWQLPNDSIFIRNVYVDDILWGHDWTAHRGVLYIDKATGVSVDILKVEGEENWTATFVRAMTTYMESVAWGALWHNYPKQAQVEEKAREQFLKAGMVSSRQRNRRDIGLGRVKSARLTPRA